MWYSILYDHWLIISAGMSLIVSSALIPALHMVRRSTMVKGFLYLGDCVLHFGFAAPL